MRYRLFIFDFDGTLVDSRINIANSVNSALVAKGRIPMPNSDIFPTIGKLPIQELFKQYDPDIDEAMVASLTEIFRNHLIKNAKDELLLFPGVETTLRALAKQGVQLAILTTKNTKVINEIVEVLGLSDTFSFIYGSGLPGGDKPSAGCVEYIWQRLTEEVSPAETVMVGDTSVDLESARNAGIDSIGVTYGVDGPAIKSQGFTHTIDNFSELLSFAA